MRKILLLLALLPALQGCFPVVATGVGVGAMMAADRRTTGTYVEDEGIEIKGSNRIDDRFHDQVHVNVTSYNRHALLTGEVPNEEVKRQVEDIVRGVPNVVAVTNETVVADRSPFSARSNDTYITSKVKARLIDANKVPVHLIKVVTERGVVYLMGIVTHKEADDAVETARTTTDVKKVVKLFEYMD